MARLEDGNGKKMLVLSDGEAAQLGLAEGAECSLHKAKAGLFVLEVTGNAGANTQRVAARDAVEELEAKGRVIDKLKRFTFAEKVEGRFEQSLAKDEATAFKAMLKSGEIEKYKSSPKYVKFLYRFVGKPQGAKTLSTGDADCVEGYSLEDHGFVVTKNELQAKRLSSEHEKAIKEGTIRGTRNFDGEFYIASSEVLNEWQPKVERLMRDGKPHSLDELAGAANCGKTLTRIVLEFLKEDGNVIEKRKGTYQMV